MATIVKPKTWAAGEGVVETDLNSDFDTIYNDYNGNVTDANIAVAAAIQASKILNTAVTCTGAAEQAVSQPTKFKLPRYNFDGNSDADYTIAGAAQTITLTTMTTRRKRVKAVAAASLSLIAGATTEGQEIVVDLSPITGTFAGAVTINHSATDTLNSIHLKGLANRIGGAASFNNCLTRLVYSKMDGSFTNFQWFEL